MSKIDLTEHRFESATLGNSRSVWIQQPRSTAPSRVCLFLDAEYYVEDIGAPVIVDRLQAEGKIPPLLVAYASHIVHETRWPESFCNPKFGQFLAEELLPWLTQGFEVPDAVDCVLAGLSLTGLSAAHAALSFPAKFSAVLCQSGSFWWNEGWLIDQLDESLSVAERSEVAFRITVGSDETRAPVDHGAGLVQSESQLDCNRRMRDALLELGHRVSYREFPGGHDSESWCSDLPESLIALLAL